MTTTLPVIVRVTCPLCGAELGPLRGSADWPRSLFQASVVSLAFEHCYELHPNASGMTWFHVESDVIKTGRMAVSEQPVVTAIQFDGLEPVPLPVPVATRGVFRRRKKARDRHLADDERFLAALRESGPVTLSEISRRVRIDWRVGRWCADRLLQRELVERLSDGRYQAR